MPSNHDDDDAAAGHGPLGFWWNYKVTFFGKKLPPTPDAEYSEVVGGLRIKGQWFVAAAFVLGGALGGFVWHLSK